MIEKYSYSGNQAVIDGFKDCQSIDRFSALQFHFFAENIEQHAQRDNRTHFSWCTGFHFVAVCARIDFFKSLARVFPTSLVVLQTTKSDENHITAGKFALIYLADASPARAGQIMTEFKPDIGPVKFSL